MTEDEIFKKAHEFAKQKKLVELTYHEIVVLQRCLAAVMQDERVPSKSPTQMRAAKMLLIVLGAQGSLDLLSRLSFAIKNVNEQIKVMELEAGLHRKISLEEFFKELDSNG